MRSFASAISCLLVGIMACAANVSTAHAMLPQPAAKPPSAVAPPAESVPFPARTQYESERVLVEIARSEARLNHRLDSLKQDPSAKWMPGMFVLLGALIAAGAGFLTQRAKLTAEERSSSRSSGRAAIADIMNFRSRQLNEFYAPIRALQGQGLAIRNQLYDQLLANPLTNYNFYQKPDKIAANNWSLWYIHAGVDKPFRMIDDLKLLNQCFPQLMPLVKEIVLTGDATAKLIREHGGYALPENDKLTDMLGAFLAHHAILKHLYDTVSTPTTVAYTAVYPRGFDKAIKEDFEKLAGELREWKSSAHALAAA